MAAQQTYRLFEVALKERRVLSPSLDRMVFTGADVARAYAQRTTLAERMRIFFESHDVLVLPVSQVPPFPADQEYPHEINGRAQETYLDWMRSAYLITVTGCPAISVPAGFTANGLPVGVQIVAPHSGERRLLEIAYAFEQRTRVGERRPALDPSQDRSSP